MKLNYGMSVCILALLFIGINSSRSKKAMLLQPGDNGIKGVQNTPTEVYFPGAQTAPTVQSSTLPGQNSSAQGGAAALTSSVSASSGDSAATVSDASAIATTGHTAIGVSAATAKTDSVQTQSGVVAVAAASNDDQMVVSQAHEETSAQKTYSQQGNYNIGAIASTDYTTGVTQTLANNGSVATTASAQYQVGSDKAYTSDQEQITYNATQTSTFQTATNSPSTLDQTKSQVVVITMDSGKEKIIIRKSFSSDSRVIIVSAAKYIKGSLAQSDVTNIRQLISGSCNCKAVKDYLIEMLAEATS